MSRICVGKCPNCDAKVYKEDGQEAAKCYFCGTVLEDFDREDTPGRTVRVEAEISRENRASDKNIGLAVTMVAMLGILFTGLAVIVGIICVSYTRKKLEARSIETSGIGNNFFGVDDQVITDEDLDPEAMEEIEKEVSEITDTIPDEDVPLGDTPRYGDLSERECKAVDSALFMLSATTLSRQVLFKCMTEGEGSEFSYDEANAAIDYMEENGLVDWYSQAVKAGEKVLETHSFNRKQLIHLLTTGEQGFTQKEAEFAADTLGLE